MEDIKFTTSLPIQIRFSDIDALGHLNNNIYLSFFDLGKGDYFEKIRGLTINWLRGAIVLAHLEMDYLNPIFYTEKLVVETKIVKLGNKSGHFLQRIKNSETDELKCICRSVFVYFDAEKAVSEPIPHAWRLAISKTENADFSLKEEMSKK